MSAPSIETALPHWEEPPADLKAAVREIKAALRARIAASGRTVEEVWASYGAGGLVSDVANVRSSWGVIL